MLIFTGTGRSGTGLYSKLFDGYHEYKNSEYTKLLNKYLPSLQNLPSDPLADPALRLTMMKEFLDGVDLATFCDSSNFYIHFLDALYAIDNDVRIVLGLRDGRDFATSGIARGYHDPSKNSGFNIEPTMDDPYYSRWQSMNPFEKMAWLWRYRNQKALDRLALIPKENWMVIRLEDLTGDEKEAHVQRLEDFTGQKANREFLTVKYNANPPHTVPIKELWAPAMHNAFMAIAGEMMHFFDYNVPMNANTPAQPSEDNQQGSAWLRLGELQSQHIQNVMYYLQSRKHDLLRVIQQPGNPELLEFCRQGGSICCRSLGETTQWVVGEQNADQEIAAYRQALRAQLPQKGLVVLVGGTIGYGVAELIPPVLNYPNFSAVVVEPSKERMLAGMHFVDLQAAFQSERFYYAVSNPDADAIVAEMQKLHLMDHDSIHVIVAPELSNRIEAESIQQCYEQKSLAWRQERDNRLQILRSLSIPSPRVQKALLIDSWQHAPGSIHLQAIGNFLQQRGVQIKLISLNRYRFDAGNEYRRHVEPQILEILEQFQPDLVLSYGYHAPHFVSQDVFDSYGAHWVQVVTNVAYYDETQYAGEHTIVMDERLIPHFTSRGYENMHFIPLMADYTAETPTPTNRNIPIVFVGNSLGLPPASVQQFFAQWQGRPELIQSIRDAEAALSDFDRQENLYDYLAKNPMPQVETVQEEYQVFRYLLCQGSAARRKAILERLAPLGLVLFGGDWDGYLPKDSLLRGCLRGTVPVHDEKKTFGFGAAFVNIHSVGHVTGPNMRFFNVAGMGGFQISDGELFERYLSPDSETVYAHSVEEYVENAKYYLAHPIEMDKIRQHAWERVRSQWTYNHWLDELSSVLNVPLSI